jgi:iron complex transport system ATP-binding protein
MSALLEASGLSLPRRLHDVALTLAPGTLTCLVGPNGSGKTSLLHAIAGIGRPGGAVAIDGVDPATLPPARRVRALGYLPASRDLDWPLVARDLVGLGGADPQEIADMLRLLELADVADRRMDRLSTGERGRVLIARVLAPRPSLLLLDEPTANLDPLWQLRLMATLRAAIADARRAALVAIHDLDAAQRFGDRIILMRDGRIVADGPPAEIIDGPHVRAVFGIEKVDGLWRPVSPAADRRSSP